MLTYLCQYGFSKLVYPSVLVYEKLSDLAIRNKSTKIRTSVLFFEEHVANMLSSAPHYVPPFHTSYFPLWQKALTYIRKKLQRFWQFDSLGLLVLVSLFLSQSFLKIISFQQWKKKIGRWFLFKLPFFFTWVLRNWTLEAWVYQPWVALSWRYYLTPWQPVLCQVAIIAVHAST